MKAARFQPPELLFSALGLGLVTAFFWRTGPHSPAVTALGILAGYVMMVCLTSPGARLRLVANYLGAWVCYGGSTFIVESLHIPLQHQRLLAWDTALFGASPAMLLQGRLQPWLLDLLSLGYLSYHVWLGWVFVDALFRAPAWRAGLNRVVFSAFALGFAGYFLLPAAPPGQAFPELFHTTISGGWLTRFNDSVNATLAARYDAFPSLHILATLAVASWDWRNFRTRFWIMLGPALLMAAATLALRLHYAVDLIASVLLFLLLQISIGRAPTVRND